MFKFIKLAFTSSGGDRTEAKSVALHECCGSGSVSQRYGSGSFYHQTKIVRRTLIPTVLRLLYDSIFLRKKNLEKNILCCCLEDHWRKYHDLDQYPDPYQNVTVPLHWPSQYFISSTAKKFNNWRIQWFIYTYRQCILPKFSPLAMAHSVTNCSQSFCECVNTLCSSLNPMTGR